jgi:hypothetical protein
MPNLESVYNLLTINDFSRPGQTLGRQKGRVESVGSG